MSRIELEQISENEVEMVLPPETPLEMVQQLTKGLKDRGLIEDLSKSTACVRYFKRPTSKATDIADELIKSLEAMSGLSKVRTPHMQMAFENQRKNREMDIADRRAKLGVKQPTNVSPAPQPLVSPAAPSIKPIAPAAPSVNTSMAPKAPQMYDHTNAAQATAGGTGKRYAYITDPVSQSEHVEGCQCDKCLEMNKSGYGPKGAGQYSSADNARRKTNNLSESTGVGPNNNVKAYSTKPGQLSGKASADLTARIQNKANKKQPVKQFSPEEVAHMNAARGLKKSAWGQHLPFPSAETYEQEYEQGEDAAAAQLARMMNSKAMFSNHQQPSKAEFDAAGETMGFAVTEEMAKNAEQAWHGTINNWMLEASKPISQRFSSEAEEIAYWDSIKVNGSSRDED